MPQEALKMTPCCPQCGSLRLRTVDRITVAQEIVDWYIDDDGQPRPNNFGDETNFYECSEPADPAHPYDCEDCGAEISDEDLLATLKPVEPVAA